MGGAAQPGPLEVVDGRDRIRLQVEGCRAVDAQREHGEGQAEHHGERQVDHPRLSSAGRRRCAVTLGRQGAAEGGGHHDRCQRQVALGDQTGGEQADDRHHVGPRHAPTHEHDQGGHKEHQRELARRRLEVRRVPLDDRLEDRRFLVHGERERQQLRTQWVERRDHKADDHPDGVVHGLGWPALLVNGLTDSASAQPGDRQDERAVGAHPHPKDRDQPPPAPLTFDDKHGERHADEPEHQRARHPVGGARADGDPGGKGRAQRGPGARQQAQQHGQDRHEDRLLDHHQAVGAQFVGPAVGPLGQPTLHDPGMPARGERVGIAPRDCARAHHVHTRAQVHEHRVVADGAGPQPEPEEGKGGDEERLEARRPQVSLRRLLHGRLFYLKFCEMLMTAGPMTTTNRAGKIQNTIGNSILTGAFSACSWAS